jgi:hypothetical protein
MPSPSTTELPVPKSWDEFEDICSDLVSRKWRDPYVMRNGRSGQKQFGVDIIGRPVHLKGQGSGIAVAQCKRVQELKEADIATEIEACYSFQPLPEEYLILTTLPRDAKLQAFVRNAQWSIPRVEILFWDDLSLYLCEFDELLKKHFPRWFRSSTSKNDLVEFLVQSIPDDFEYDDSLGQYLHRHDVAVTLQLARPDELSPFEEAWVENFPDKHAYVQEVYLEYNGKRVETYFFADVDGARHLVPHPKSAADLRISRFQYHLARILNARINGNGIDHALKVAGIVVDSTKG